MWIQCYRNIVSVRCILKCIKNTQKQKEFRKTVTLKVTNKNPVCAKRPKYRRLKVDSKRDVESTSSQYLPRSMCLCETR